MKGFEWLKDMVVDLAVSFLTKLLDGRIKDKELAELGYRHGKFLTDHCRESVGDNWNKLENVIQSKADVYLAGVRNGLDYDDK